MPDEPHKNGNGKAKWVAIVSTVVSFVVGVAFSAYILGQRTGKVLELDDWKTETAPRIERMDRSGTTSFDLFHQEYLRTQERQEAWLKDLEKQIHDKEIADIKERLLTLERKPHENSN